jgi:uncharacterized protein (TIGR00369 family)
MQDVPSTARDDDRSDPADPWREPVRGGHPDLSLAAGPGIDLIRALIADEAVQPPLSRLTGLRATGVGVGTASFSLPLTGWLCGADGRIALGALTIPADAAMACAIIAGLPPATGLTTTELALRQIHPAPPGGLLLAHASVLDLGPPVALAEVSLTDEGGRLIARGGSLCVTLPAAAAPAGTDRGDQPAAAPAGTDRGDQPAPAPADLGPDPWQRRAPEALSGPGTPAGSPLGRLTGLRPVAVGAGEATVALPATRWLCAPPPGRVQGGALAVLAGAAITAAIDTAAPAGGGFVPIELKLNYVRPLASDGREARAHAKLIHGGRRIAVAGAEVVDADGRLIAVATGSAVAAGGASPALMV